MRRTLIVEKFEVLSYRVSDRCTESNRNKQLVGGKSHRDGGDAGLPLSNNTAPIGRKVVNLGRKSQILH